MNVFGILSSDDEETLTEENYCEKRIRINHIIDQI